jgi:hypothetical protein
MPNTFIPLDVPRGDGTGAPTSVGLTGHPKTFVLAGPVAPGARYVVEGSHDGVTWDILVDDNDGTQVLFTTGATGAKTVDCIVQDVRVRSIAASAGGQVPSITMGAPPANGPAVIGALDVPPVGGLGAPFDLGLSTGPLKTFMLRGKVPHGSRYTILASMDGAQFDEVMLFTSDQEGARSRSVMCRFVRVQRAAGGETPTITVGAEALFEPAPAGLPGSELSIASDRELATVTETDEEVLVEYAVPLPALRSASLVADFSALGQAAGADATATFRIRQGGTTGIADGVELAALPCAGPESLAYVRTDPFSPPTGNATLVKVTGRGAPGARAVLRGFVLRFYPSSP